MGELPRFVSGPRVAASSWVIATMALLVGACALNGLSPQLDHGRMRGLVALVSAAATVGVLVVAFRDKGRAGAVGRTLGIATLGGVVVSFLCGAALFVPTEGAGVLVALAVMSGVFGGASGLAYGLPLAVVTWLTARHHLANTRDGDDRAARIAGVLLALGALAVLGHAVTPLSPLDPAERLGSAAGHELLLPCVDALLVAAGAGIALAAQRRIRARARWLDAVRAGRVPSLTIRAIGDRDALAGLPRLGPGCELVVWRPAPLGAYRSSAAGAPVAIV